MRTAPLDRLRGRQATLGAPLCLGLDPHPDALPDEISRDVQGIERFARGLLEAAAEFAAAVKINVAFFEALGSAGWGALERVRGDVPEGLIVILDAKRGDIGSTAERQATALFDHLRADGVTLSPYLGEDAVQPFVDYADRLIYVLARTSNPDAGRLQDLVVRGQAGERPLHEEVARWVAGRWPEGRVGLVVGATAPGELERLRSVVPDPPFLVPGVGAQGGDLAAAIRACHGSRGPGLVNISRAIAGASGGSDWQRAAGEAARRWQGEMAEVGATLPA